MGILNILVRKQRHSHGIDKRSTTLILTDPIPLHHFHPSPPTTHPVQLHHRKTILHNPWLSSYSLLIFPVLLPAHHAVTRRKHHLRCCRNHPSFRNIPFPRHSVLQLYSISQQPCLGKHTSIKASLAPATLIKPPFLMRRGHPYGLAPRTSR